MRVALRSAETVAVDDADGVFDSLTDDRVTRAVFVGESLTVHDRLRGAVPLSVSLTDDRVPVPRNTSARWSTRMVGAVLTVVNSVPLGITCAARAGLQLAPPLKLFGTDQLAHVAASRMRDTCTRTIRMAPTTGMTSVTTPSTSSCATMPFPVLTPVSYMVDTTPVAPSTGASRRRRTTNCSVKNAALGVAAAAGTMTQPNGSVNWAAVSAAPSADPAPVPAMTVTATSGCAETTSLRNTLLTKSATSENLPPRE